MQLNMFNKIIVSNSHLSISGVIKGDEIMVLNGAIVSDLDMMFLESVLQEEISLCMMMRSARTGIIPLDIFSIISRHYLLTL